MMQALAVAALVAVGAPWPLVGLLVVGLARPALGLIAIYLLVLSRRTGAGAAPPDARFCRLVADELRAGGSLRSALEVTARDRGDTMLERLCRLGRPYADLAGRVAVLLPVVGPAAASAVLLAGQVGGRVAASFEALGQMAADEDQMRRERRAASAQARASATLIAAIPPVLLALLIVTGDAGVLRLAGTTGIWMMGTGIGLIVLGLVVMWGVVQSAEVRR